MDLRIVTQPQQGASHASLLSLARAAKDSGFSAFFRSDHLLKIGQVDGLPGPSDSIASLAALSAQVPDLRFGSLVMAATFRHPSILAMAAATIDDISDGRFELGLGSGWFEAEHHAYGIDYGSSFTERFDRLTEQLEVITGLWSTPEGSHFDYIGRHYTIHRAPGLPKPRQCDSQGVSHIPIIIGGLGARRTPHLAARFADEFNVGYTDLDTARAQMQRVRKACGSIGREAGTVTYSAAQTVVCARDMTTMARRAEAIGRSIDDVHGTTLLGGSPDEVVDRLGRWSEVGISRFYLQILDLEDLDHVALLGATVVEQLGERRPADCSDRTSRGARSR